MNRVRNNPEKYVKRSDLGPKRQDKSKARRTAENLRREKDYLIAPIDTAGYIDFGALAAARRRI